MGRRFTLSRFETVSAMSVSVGVQVAGGPGEAFACSAFRGVERVPTRDIVHTIQRMEVRFDE